MYTNIFVLTKNNSSWKIIYHETQTMEKIEWLYSWDFITKSITTDTTWTSCCGPWVADSWTWLGDWTQQTDTTITFGQCGGKESSCQCRRLKGTGLNPRARKSPWRKWQPTPVFLPGESRGQGSLVHYSPWGHKEPDKTKRLECTCMRART